MTMQKAAMMRWVQAMPISEDQQAETSAMWGRPGFASNLEPMHQHDCMSYGRCTQVANYESDVRILIYIIRRFG